MTARPVPPIHRCRLYLVTPPEIPDIDRFAVDLDAALAAGDVACVQLRLKPAGPAMILATAAALRPVVHAHGAILLVNDHVELVAATGAEGAHLGQQDLPIADARRRLGPGAVIGATCHDSRHLAMLAAEAGADYVAFGAFFPSPTKPDASAAALDTLAWWAEMMEIPCAAIGGITPDNALPLIEAGADFLAVSSSVWRHRDGPAAAVRAFAPLLARSGPPLPAADR